MSTANAEPIGLATRILPVEEIRPNNYNPNRMTEDEFAELVAEVRHLGRLPKPVVVRPRMIMLVDSAGDANQGAAGFEIVDGEHNWRAGQEAGLTEIACEVVEADDFEAMRQTYKRNQHGTHNPLLLGRMFQQMMGDRNLSRRKLAEEIDISEGTIRNALEYVKADEVRNSYAPENPARVRNSYAVERPTIDGLSLRQVRAFNWLPPKLANLWFDTGADLKCLYGVKTNGEVEDGEGSFYWTKRHKYQAWVKSGLADFLPKYISGKGESTRALKQLEKWDEFEQSWLVGPFADKRETLREYTKHYFQGVFYVRDESMMDHALEFIIDRKTGEFLLTPEEFSDCIETVAAERSSAHDFQERLEAEVLKKHGRKPDSKYHLKRDLMRLEIDKYAPDYIKESKLRVERKHELLGLYRELRNWPQTKERVPATMVDCLEPKYTEEALKVMAERAKAPRKNNLYKSPSGWHSLSAAKGVFSKVATPFVPQGVPPN